MATGITDYQQSESPAGEYFAKQDFNQQRQSQCATKEVRNPPTLYCISLRQQGVDFDFLAMTPGGYMASIFDPCDNSISIGYDSFESRSNIDLSGWDEYRRY